MGDCDVAIRKIVSGLNVVRSSRFILLLPKEGPAAFYSFAGGFRVPERLQLTRAGT